MSSATISETTGRACIVSDDGEVTMSCSYGGQRGYGVGKLNRPCHLAVDKDSQFIFVADEWNNRYVLLSLRLEFVCHISEEMSSPYRLYLHHTTRRLLVGHDYAGDVTVIQL